MRRDFCLHADSLRSHHLAECEKAALHPPMGRPPSCLSPNCLLLSFPPLSILSLLSSTRSLSSESRLFSCQVKNKLTVYLPVASFQREASQLARCCQDKLGWLHCLGPYHQTLRTPVLIIFSLHLFLPYNEQLHEFEKGNKLNDNNYGYQPVDVLNHIHSGQRTWNCFTSTSLSRMFLVNGWISLCNERCA